MGLVRRGRASLCSKRNHMEVNSYWIQFTGKFNVSEKLDRDKTVIIGAEFDHLKYEERPNEDGTVDAFYKLAPIRMKVENGGKRLMGKVKSRNSQRLRGALFYQAQENNVEDFDSYYEQFTDRLIAQLPEVIKLLNI